MTNKHTDAQEAFEIICERLHGYQTAKDIVRAALSPVDVEKIKDEAFKDLQLSEMEHWKRCIDYLSQRGMLKGGSE